MWATDNRPVKLMGMLLMSMSFLNTPSDLKAQSNDDALMRLVCFDSAATTGNQGGNGWAIVITQVSNDNYAADIFIPDANGDYADRFPMFTNTGFFFSIFENAPAKAASVDIETFVEDLFVNNTDVMTRLAEGSRVGTLLDLTLEGSGALKFDSKDQAMNYFFDPLNNEERAPVCEPPFRYQMTQN